MGKGPAGIALLLLAFAGEAGAQSFDPTDITSHRFEIGARGGIAFTGSRDVYYGTTGGNLDVEDGGFWGLTLDFNVDPGAQFGLLYQRQDSRMTFNQGFGTQDVADVAIEYWHAGGLYGVPRGRMLPYGKFTVGATHLNYKNSPIGDDWKLSIQLAGGAKFYTGSRLGINLEAGLPLTFISGGASVGCGPAGCFTTVGGTGVSQFTLGGGAFLRF